MRLYIRIYGILRAGENVACEEMREGESVGSPGVRRAQGVVANGGDWRGHAKPSTHRREIASRELPRVMPLTVTFL